MNALPLDPDLKARIRDGDASKYNGNRSDLVWAIVCELVRTEVNDASIEAILLNKTLGISAHIYDQGSPPDYARKQVRDAHKKAGGRIFNPASPMKTAHIMVFDRYTAHGHPIIQCWNGFYVWASTHYAELAEATINSHISKYLEKSQQPGPKGALPIPFNPTTKKIAEVRERLKEIRHLEPRQVAPPCWLDDKPHPPASEIMACRNGLLHLPTRKLLSKNTQFFNMNAVGFDYDPAAPAPERWLQFLNELWPGDTESPACLQEVYGYFLTPDTSQQKLFYMVGPKRCGKGTVARVVKNLVGPDNVVAPNLSNLPAQFGRQSLIGKQLALVPDFRLSGGVSNAQITEHLLQISGEDEVTIPRKHMDDWTGTLGVRFLLQSNELPKLADASGALVSRFILLQIKESFYGREDRGLTKKLLTELPGILNWAIEGWARLRCPGQQGLTTIPPPPRRNAGSNSSTSFGPATRNRLPACRRFMGTS